MSSKKQLHAILSYINHSYEDSRKVTTSKMPDGSVYNSFSIGIDGKSFTEILVNVQLVQKMDASGLGLSLEYLTNNVKYLEKEGDNYKLTALGRVFIKNGGYKKEIRDEFLYKKVPILISIISIILAIAAFIISYNTYKLKVSEELKKRKEISVTLQEFERKIYVRMDSVIKYSDSTH